jgi:hypothetical protein
MKKFLISLALLFSAQFGNSQILVKIGGSISDNKGMPLSGVSIFLEGTTLGGVSDDSGNYEILNVVPGSYNLTAQYLGYSTSTKFNVIIKSKGNPAYNFTLVESREELEAVLIENSNRLRFSTETPLSIQSLSAVEIATYPGGNNDVVRVAQSFPGVSPSIGGFRNDLIIRGGAPNESVYYLDGMEVPNINHFATQGSSGGPVGLLNVSFIEDVALSTSGFGAQYDNPLSGVLQFKQRDGNNERLNTNIRISATDTALTLEGPLFKGQNEKADTSFLFSLRRSYLQALFKLIGLPIRPDYWDYQYKITHKIDDYNMLYITGLGSIDDFTVEVPGEFDELAQAVLEQAPYIEQRTNVIGVSWNSRFRDNSGFMLNTLSHNRLNNVYTTYIDTASRNGILFENDAIESETKLRHKTTKFFGDWKVSGGFNMQYSDYSNSTVNNLDNVFYDSEIDFLKYGLFANATTSLLNNKLNLAFGFRMDDDNFLSDQSLLATFSPRISLNYEIRENWYLSALAGRYFKLPPYTILGFRDNLGKLENKDIEYIRSDHYVLGLQYIPNASSKISLEGYYKHYSNYPVSVLDGISLANKGADFEVLGNENIETVGKGRSYGLELQYQQKLRKRLYAIFSYTYFISEFSGFDNSTFLPSVWDSRHLISFLGGYKLKKNWELSSRFRFAGKTPYVPVDLESSLVSYPELQLDYSRLGDVKIGVFSQLDARIDKIWNFKRWSFNLYFEVQNMLFQSIPTPPEFALNRNSSGNLIEPRSLTEIDTDTSTPIPSIGIVIDF